MPNGSPRAARIHRATRALIVASGMLGTRCAVYDESLLGATSSPAGGGVAGDEVEVPDVGSGGVGGEGGSAGWASVEPMPEAGPAGGSDAPPARRDASAGGGGAGGAGGVAGSPDAAAGRDGSPADATDGARDATDATPANDANDASAAPDAGSCAGMAIRFDGSISYATARLLSGDDFTMEAWIRTTASRPGTSAYQGLGFLYADVAGGAASDFGVSITSQTVAFVVGNPDTTLLGTVIISTGAWTHVAVTRQKATGIMSIIINGVLNQQTTHPNRTSLTASPTLTIGANTVSDKYYIGDIDEVRFWRVVRTPAQIAQTFHTRLVGDEAGLEDYYRFDQTGGSTIPDVSTTKAARNDAAITGNPVFVPSDAPICN